MGDLKDYSAFARSSASSPAPSCSSPPPSAWPPRARPAPSPGASWCCPRAAGPARCRQPPAGRHCSTVGHNIHQISNSLNQITYIRFCLFFACLIFATLIILALIGTTDTDLFNPLVPKLTIVSVYIISFTNWASKAVKANWRNFFGTPGTNGLSMNTRRYAHVSRLAKERPKVVKIISSEGMSLVPGRAGSGRFYGHIAAL